jgi:4-amino-4-deoxychorismate synthase (2-amino-4-deoxychorismate-forming) component I
MTRPSVSPRTSILGPFTTDSDTLLRLHAVRSAAYPALLESAAPGEPLGRHDLLFATVGTRLELGADLSVRSAPPRIDTGRGFLAALDDWWQRESTAAARMDVESSGAALPFSGGWLLLLGYELAGEIERSLELPRACTSPVACAWRAPAAFVRASASGLTWIVAEPGQAALAQRMRADLASLATRGEEHFTAGSPLAVNLEDDPPGRYLDAVNAALGHIRDGDIYQANLSRTWRCQLAAGVTAVDVYRRLRAANPAPFAGLLEFDGRAIASSSPERLVEVRNGLVATRPIAGTRPRGATPALDAALVVELRAHPKERAEHVMLIDLERNDLGRVCERGSVVVDEYMAIESYAHVHHIVSNVRGRLRQGTSPGEVIRAVFPGGTITGCPKVRCMEIIGRLEGEPRGAYTGSIGYLGRDGTLDLNILIRTMEIDGRQVCFRAGAGIVADSDPERELEETRAKARGLVRALGA